MPRFHCRWRRVLICMCTSCMCLVLLFIYVGVTVCLNMMPSYTPGTNTVFVAPGLRRNHGFAPWPETFWEQHLHGDAMWNHLQLAIDQYFNPILQPNNNKTGSENSTLYESLLRQSFVKVTRQDSLRNMSQLMQEFVSHMHKRDYPTIIQPSDLCGAGEKDEKAPTFLLLAIKSTESNLRNRQAIRKTWGQVGWVTAQRSSISGKEVGVYVCRVFLMGKNQEGVNTDSSKLLQAESELYGDILQWDFKDTFFNLTLKDVLFWNWFSRYCSHIRFVFKGDDDVFVNTHKLIAYLQDELQKSRADQTMKDFMVGNVIGGAVPNRNSSSKYFIPDSFYKGLYPAYAGGAGVVYTGTLTKRLLNISKRVHLFPIDDVYVGMCMIRLNSHLTHHPGFLPFDFPEEEKKDNCSYNRILLVHKRSPQELVTLWAHIKKTQTECSDLPQAAKTRSSKKQHYAFEKSAWKMLFKLLFFIALYFTLKACL